MIRGFFYRLVMRLAHRFHWHYAPPIFVEGDTQLWCKWCGFRQTVTRRAGVDAEKMIARAVEQAEQADRTYLHEGRGSLTPTPPETVLPKSPETEAREQTNTLIARLTADSRAKRYVKGRRAYPVYELPEESSDETLSGRTPAAVPRGPEAEGTAAGVGRTAAAAPGQDARPETGWTR